MRTLHVQKAAGVSGSEQHLLGLLPGLCSRGVDVTMCVLEVPGAERFVEALSEQGIHTLTLPAGPDANPVVAWQLRRMIRQLRPSLVHTHLIHADVHGQVAALLAGAPGVLSMHGTHGFHRREPFRSAARFAGRLARRTIAISEYAARFVREVGLAPAERIRVVPYGIDVGRWSRDGASREEARASFGLDPGAIVVGVASRLIPFKGHDFLLHGIAEARRQHPEIIMLVAGDGPLREELAAQAGALIPQDRVRFLGFVTDMIPFMAACDVVAFLTMPELGEGFGLAALEAMAAARPLIATKVASLPEIVADGKTGILVEPRAVDQLAAALVRLARDTELRIEMGASARRRARSEFSVDAMVDRTAAVYEEVLAERRTSSGRRLGS